jgi:hypothetical protein
VPPPPPPAPAFEPPPPPAPTTKISILVTPEGFVQVVETMFRNSIMQYWIELIVLSQALTPLLDPTSWLHFAGLDSLPETAVAPEAFGDVTTEIADSVETAKTKGINEATKRRALRMEVARLAAIPVCFLSAPVDDYPICNQEMPELMEH